MQGEGGSGFASGCAVTQLGKPGVVSAPNVMGMNEQALIETFVANGGTAYADCAATELAAMSQDSANPEDTAARLAISPALLPAHGELVDRECPSD